ncbi:MAG TPA: sigma-70 family RNA polymerase sigma factor [Solirubrobacteraceae bacterium]|nr:sigma-70 family RNA polymerase sigma factor [Solirubrobacteraceae bacterium]
MARLYERFAPLVYGYALRRSDRETAEEVTAEVFLVAWRRREDLPAEPLPWLYGVARRVLSQQRRGAGRRRALRDRLRYASTGPVETALELSDRSLAAALARLSEGDREALLLRYWEELAPERVAEALGCSRGAAAVRLHRARRRLARELTLQVSDACVEASST